MLKNKNLSLGPLHVPVVRVLRSPKPRDALCSVPELATRSGRQSASNAGTSSRALFSARAHTFALSELFERPSLVTRSVQCPSISHVLVVKASRTRESRYALTRARHSFALSERSKRNSLVTRSVQCAFTATCKPLLYRLAHLYPLSQNL